MLICTPHDICLPATWQKQHLEDESGDLVSLEEEVKNMLKTNNTAF